MSSVVRRVKEGEYNPADFLPVSEHDIEEMYQELLGYLRQIRNPYLRRLTDAYFVENENFIRRFKFHSAAKTVHHGYIGTAGHAGTPLGVLRICNFYVKTYPFLNRDLLFTAAAFHDVGKASGAGPYFRKTTYTDDGQLLGAYRDRNRDGRRKHPQNPGLPEEACQRIKALHSGAPRRAGVRLPEKSLRWRRQSP